MSNYISVAIASFNGENYIIEQLLSIYEQSQIVDEVIICDDQSTDNTVKIVNDFIILHNLKSWKITVNDNRLGFCNNFWKAISLCHGDIIFLCDQDDVWYETKVENMIKILKGDEQTLMVSSSYDTCNSSGSIIDASIPYKRGVNNGGIEKIELNYLIGRSPIRGCSMCFKKKILNNVNLIDLKNGLGHDWLISCLACINGHAFFYNTRLFKYRIHNTNTSSQKMKHNRHTLYSIINKRIKYLTEERDALNLLLSHDNLDKHYYKLLREQYIFDSRRLDLICNMKVSNFLQLALSIQKYAQIYEKGVIYGFRLYIGDFIYAYIKKLRYKGSNNED